MDVWIDDSPALRQNQVGSIAVVYRDGRTLVGEIGMGTNNETENRALIEEIHKFVVEHDIDYVVVIPTLYNDFTTTYNGNHGELCERDTRTLSSEYPISVRSMIVIQGTTVITEFGSIAGVTMVIGIATAIIGSLVVQKKLRPIY